MSHEDTTEKLTSASANDQLVNLLSAVIQPLEARLIGMEQLILERLNATRPLESQMLVALQELRAEVAELRVGQQRLEAKVAELRLGQQELRVGQQELRAGQQRLETEVAELRAKQQRMEERAERFYEETNQNFRILTDEFNLFNEDLLKMRAEERDLKRRVKQLELAEK